MTTDTIRQKLPLYFTLMRLDRPIGILLLLWPTLMALYMAGNGTPSLVNCLIFIAGVIVMRSAGCVINDFADRKVDGLVSRTRTRPLASGQLDSRDALILFALLGLVAFVLVLFLNTFTLLLSFGGIALATLYPFMKRYTHLPQVVLGAAFGWAVPMAFAAEQSALPKESWLLYLATLVWTVAYDTQYAMVDRDDDLKAGIKSTAILFGDMDIPMIALLQLLTVFILYLIGANLHLGPWWYAGLFAASTLFAYQLWLIRDRAPAHCFRAFLNNHWVGGCLFASLFLHYATLS